jgi:small ligand-binding sensory domain FIST
MQWANALSTRPSLEAALREVVEVALSQLQTAPQQPVLARSAPVKDSGSAAPSFSSYSAHQAIQPDLAVLFVSSAFASEFSRVMPLLQEILSVSVLIGCSGAGIAGGGREVEEGPAVSLSLALMPGVNLQSFHLEAEDLPDMDAPPDAWTRLIGVAPRSQPHFVLLTDGFTSNVSDLLRGLDFAYPTAVKVGGLASGGRAPNSNALFLGQFSGSDTRSQLLRSGTVGVALAGDVVVEAVVAQGCRPIGVPLQVTDTDRNIITRLANQTPLTVLQTLVSQLDPADQKLVRNSLFIGVLMDEFKPNPESGDFLIRVILGIDPSTGVIAIGDRIRPGQTVQFHLRDAQTSAEDLNLVLNRFQQLHHQDRGPAPVGALMFACLGRGEHLYGQPDFDSQAFKAALGDLPLGGFFCNGEIGPVGSSTFLHGYTSSFGIFRSSV